MRQNIAMFYEYSDGPGHFMGQHVWFIGNSKFYRIWSQYYDEAHRVLLKHVREPLTLRRMIKDIREVKGLDISEVIGSGAELLPDINVTGIGEFEAGLLKLAWCNELPFLLQLNERTLALLAPGLNDVCDPDTFAAVSEVIDTAEEHHVPVSVLETGFRELVPLLNQGLDVWVDGMLARIVNRQPLGPNKSVAAQCHTAEQLVRLTDGPSPGDPEAVASFFQTWQKVYPKPVVYKKDGGTGTTSSYNFFSWLVKRVGPTGFQALKAKDRDGAKRFADTFLAHANYEIHRYKTSTGGGAMGAGIRRKMMGDWPNLIEHVLGQTPTENRGQ